MRIHREGYPTLMLILSLLVVLDFIILYLVDWNSMVESLVFSASVALFLFFLVFFRSPSRNVVFSEGKILAPADGEVVVIEEVQDSEYFNNKRIQVSIFMSPFNVHVNWSPIQGIVKYFKYHPGKFLVAWLPKSSTDNERTSLVIETLEKQEIMLRQIAGFVARRIVNYSKPGVQLKQGEQFGFIKFGSRVDILLPPDAKITVDLNQKVKGTQTVIAEL